MPVQPLVSIVISYYDHGRHLHQTVHSCLRAYSGPLEIVLVNDGSIEAKAAHYIDAASALSPSVKVVTQKNQGLSAARNAGIRNSSGAFVQLLDSDDMLVPGKVDLQVEHFQLQPTIGVSLTNYLLTDPGDASYWRDGDPISRFTFSAEDFLFHWERGFSLPIHTALFRREVFTNAPFETTLTGKEDWVFWSRLALAGHRMSYAPVFGAIYRQHPTSMSKSFKTMGDSWLAASALIEAELAPEKAAALRNASQSWHETFYRPRIDQAPKSAAPAPKHADAEPESVAANGWLPLSECLKRSDEAPTISVIVPVYNHFRYLRECLNSILAQKLDRPVEVIVINDASTDERVAPLLRTFARLGNSIKVISNEMNLGIAATQNKAAAAARGTFLAFLDCDDRLAENAFATIDAELEGPIDYLFTDRTDIDANGKRVRIARYGGYAHLKPSDDIRSDLLDGMVASHLKVIRREAFLAVGGFDPKCGGVQDWEMALKMAQADARFRYLPQPLYVHRLHTGSVTGEDSARQFWLSNVVRRRFATASLRPGLSDVAAKERAQRALTTESAGAVVFRGGISTERLKAAWRAGNACAYVARIGAETAEVAMLREYNSYFDAILAPDEATACALIGYVWNHEALHLDGERL